MYIQKLFKLLNHINTMSSTPSINKPARKPRTTKKKNTDTQSVKELVGAIIINNADTENKVIAIQAPEEKIYKKRGRKPKGGKIVPDDNLNKPQKNHISNIIIHLKCKQEDLIQYNHMNNSLSEPFKHNDNSIYPLPYTDNNSTDLLYSEIDLTRNNKNTDTCYYKLENENENKNKNDNDLLKVNNYVERLDGIDHSERSENPKNTNISGCNKRLYCSDNLSYKCKCYDNQKEINEKLIELSYQLYANNLTDKRSSCFWCTCQFDTPTVMIPKFELNKIYNCYGCFCSPECATSYLFSEKITTSVRFERYHLLNYIYCKIYNYNRNINMAPNPYYTLDKYYGNLTIQEYRKLLKTERLLVVIDKPMTRILPELHEYNASDIMSASGIEGTNSKYKIRKRKHQTKNDILSDNFNFTQSS